MTSSAYSDPRLAAVYDALNPPGEDTDFFLSLAGPRPRAVLDLGCGTGQLACALAAQGHHVTGVDPAAAMLEIARRRPGGDRVAWTQGNAAGLALEHRFDLIVMTGHAFQVLLDDAAILAGLRSMRRHLAPGGQVAFETRNPAVEAWRDWTPEATRTELDLPGIGRVEVTYAVTAVTDSLVRYETRFRFADDERHVAEDTLRFVAQPELAAFLDQAGFTEVDWYGGWDSAPFAADSAEILVVAR